jgi:tetratricopeptide (TPR) repeat protein
MGEHEYHFFLSFRGDDLELAKAVDEVLCAQGYRVWFQPRSSALSARFPQAIDAGLESSERVLAIVTRDYFQQSSMTRAEFDYGLLRDKLVVLKCDDVQLPPTAQSIVYQECPLAPNDADFAELVRRAAQLQPTMVARVTKNISFARLPEWNTSADTRFVGRQAELDQLASALEDRSCSVVCVVADGGYGKSSLVRTWLESIRHKPRHEDYLGISAGFSYSFSSQAGDNQTDLTSNAFFRTTLTHFESAPVDERQALKWPELLLKNLRRQKRALLVLDGLEPHQVPEGRANAGSIDDAELREFIDELVQQPGNSTTVITSRVMPSSLKKHQSSGQVRVIRLAPLELPSSLQVLAAAGLNPATAETLALAEGCKGHPLLLSLVGPAVAHGTYDLAQFERHSVPSELSGRNDFQLTVRRFIDSQLPTLGAEAAAVLFATCMFDKPIEFDQLKARLLNRASIPRITSPLWRREARGRARFSEALFVRGVESLKAAAMLSLKEGESGQRVLSAQPSTWTLEVHPLIQTGIQATLMERYDLDWRKAHWTIYRTLVDSVKAWRPSVKEDLLTLYAAIPHGVRAGRGWRAGWMYGLRCLRGFRAYSTNQHGMIGYDVEALSHYFQGRWATLKEDIGLGSFDKTQAYAWSGLVLIGTNRLDDGCTLMERGLSHAKETRNFVTASRTARHLGFIRAVAGHRSQSIALARESITLLEEQRPALYRLIDRALVMMPHQRMSSRANLGCVLHYFGELEEAEAMFRQAEGIQARATRYPRLRAIWGYRYADLLLDLGRFDEADDRFKAAMVDPNEPKGWGEGVFAEPLLQLGFVRSQIRQADHLDARREWHVAVAYANAFRGFGERDQKMRLDVLVPSFRTALAGVARLSGNLDAAASEVQAARAAAKLAGSRLFNIEISVEEARILLARGQREDAARVLAEADSAEPGIAYRRRELELLAKSVGQARKVAGRELVTI